MKIIMTDNHLISDYIIILYMFHNIDDKKISKYSSGVLLQNNKHTSYHVDVG